VPVDYAARDADQVVYVGLEQLVARIGLQDIDHRLAVVTVRIEAEVLHDALDFPAQNRDVTRAAVIGGGGPQAEEAVLAGNAAASVECFDSDVVQVLRTMNARE